MQVAVTPEKENSASVWERRIAGFIDNAFLPLLAVLAIVPLLGLAFYSYPGNDDFVFTYFYRKYGWLGFQQYFYRNWQGLYTTNALVGSPLNPVAANRFDLFWLPSWLSVFFTYACLVAFVQYVGRSWKASWLLASAIMLAYLYQAPSWAEAFYWFNANIAYQCSIGAGLLFLILLFRTFAGNNVPARYWWASAGAAALLIGANFITATLVCFVLLAGTALSFRSGQHQRAWLGLLLVGLGCLTVVVVAPGNTVRLQGALQNSAAAGYHVGFASKIKHGLTHSTALSIYSVVNWLGDGVILVLAFLVLPAMQQISQRPNAPINQFSSPKSWIILICGLMVLLPFYPSYVTQGGPPVVRITNVSYFIFICFCLLGAYYLLQRSWRSGTALRIPVFLKVIAAVFLTTALLTDDNRAISFAGKLRNLNNITTAYREWLNGSAKKYYLENLQRHQLLRDSQAPVVVLDSIQNRPVSLYLHDLTPDSTDRFNRAYANYFGKKAVYIAKPQSRPASGDDR